MMRAKLRVAFVESNPTTETLHFNAVTGTDPFGPNGESEDNTYARFTPSAELKMVVTNPELIGKFKMGDTFYVDFIPAS